MTYFTLISDLFVECLPACAKEQFGCCDDNTTAAHGPNKEGCCLYSQYGCCPDNIVPANGPSLQGKYKTTRTFLCLNYSIYYVEYFIFHRYLCIIYKYII